MMGKIKVIFFDLDDTLYPMMEDVAQRIHETVKKFNLSQVIEKWWLEEYRANGPKKRNLINKLIEKFNLRIEVNEMLEVFRNVPTNIRLEPEVEDGLAFLKYRNFKLILITNGIEEVQKKKIKALNLKKFMDRIFIASGAYQKPSTYLFEKVLNSYNVSPDEAIGIGDWYEVDGKPCEKLGIRFVYFSRTNKVIQEKIPSYIPIVNSFMEFVNYVLQF